jgi:hypothetical protein
VLSPGLMELELGGTVGRSTYKPLTGMKLTESAPRAALMNARNPPRSVLAPL